MVTLTVRVNESLKLKLYILNYFSLTATTIAVYRNKTGIVEHFAGGGKFQVQGPFTLSVSD